LTPYSARKAGIHIFYNVMNLDLLSSSEIQPSMEAVLGAVEG